MAGACVHTGAFGYSSGCYDCVQDLANTIDDPRSFKGIDRSVFDGGEAWVMWRSEQADGASGIQDAMNRAWAMIVAQKDRPTVELHAASCELFSGGKCNCWPVMV